MSDQTGTTYRCPECSGLDHVHKPNCPQHNDGERWTIYVCPRCGRSTMDWKDGIECDCDVSAWDEIEVVTAARADALAEALERLLTNAEHIFDKQPVRDWGETLAEARRALSTPEKGKG